jgi:hypothetical protein
VHAMLTLQDDGLTLGEIRNIPHDRSAFVVYTLVIMFWDSSGRGAGARRKADAAPGVPARLRVRVGRVRARLGQVGQFDGEPGPDPVIALHAHAAAEERDQLPRYGQAEPGAAVFAGV